VERGNEKGLPRLRPNPKAINGNAVDNLTLDHPPTNWTVWGRFFIPSDVGLPVRFQVFNNLF